MFLLACMDNRSLTNNRINWIDWAKFFAITMVVFCHIPQPQDSFLKFYIGIFHMPLFFFISGYLTKVRKDTKEEFSKWKRSLIIPYFIYNLIFYPYWVIRLYVDNGGDIGLFDYLVKPIIGLFLLQIDTPISCSVNGVTWFLVALIIMRMIVHFCSKSRYSTFYMIFIALLSVLLFIITSQYESFDSFTRDGVFKCMPLYLLGFITRKHDILNSISPKYNLIWAVLLIFISVVCGKIYHDTNSFVIEMVSFYIVLVTATYGFMFLCQLLDSQKSSIMVDLSLGMLMIMGLHWMYIGTTNFVLEHLLHLQTGIEYPWYISILFALAIDFAIYPLIIFAKKHMPILLGK